MRVDAHQHFWKLDRGDYGWLTPELEPIYRDYQPEDLVPHLEEHDINRTVLVQAAPTVEETEYLLDLYESNDFIGGVVGWLDMESESFTEEFTRFNRHDGFVGLRPMIHDIEDERWILRPPVMDNLHYLVEQGFPFDILIFPLHLPVVLEVLEQLPELRGVVDHIAKPPIEEGELEPWKTNLARVAENESIHCKLSGMITEADHEDWSAKDLEPYVHHTLEVFGSERVMFGSDWPVCELAGSYNDVVSALLAALPSGLSEDEEKAIFGQNASRFYRLDNQSSAVW